MRPLMLVRPGNIIERPDRTTHMLERQARQVAAGDARTFDEDDFGDDGLEGGAEVPLTLQPEHAG